MSFAEWIMIGLLAGGLGVSAMASRQGWGGTKDLSKKSTRAQSSSNRGRYYHGGK